MIEFYKVITITHHMLDVKDIGHYVVSESGEDTLSADLTALKELMIVEELVYLTTCNRVTFILYTDIEIDYDFIVKFFLKANSNLSAERIEAIMDRIGVYVGMEAIRHVFEVASSVDSLVIGEREIYRQLRSAFEQSKKYGIVGDNMRILEKLTVQIAKKVYSTTRIGEKPLSIVALAMESIQSIGRGPDSKVILIGAGETNQLVGKFLKRESYTKVDVFNRSLEKASTLADVFGGDSYRLEDLNAYQKGFDIAVVTTGSQSVILDYKITTDLCKNDGKHKLIVDLSVPRNVSEEVENLPYVNYVGIDDLKQLVEKNMNFRRQEVSIAKQVITKNLKVFQNVFQQRQIEVALSELPSQVKELKSTALDIIYKEKIDAMDEKGKETLYEIINYFEKKYIGIPMKIAKTTIQD